MAAHSERAWGSTELLRLLALGGNTRGDTVAPTGLLLAMAAFMFVAAWVTWRWPGLWPPRLWDHTRRLSEDSKRRPRRWLPPLVLAVVGSAILVLAIVR